MAVLIRNFCDGARYLGRFSRRTLRTAQSRMTRANRCPSKQHECRAPFTIDKRLRSWGAFLCALIVLAAVGLFEKPIGAAELPPKYQVKAAFLINFPKYMDWPPK